MVFSLTGLFVMPSQVLAMPKPKCSAAVQSSPKFEDTRYVDANAKDWVVRLKSPDITQEMSRQEDVARVFPKIHEQNPLTKIFFGGSKMGSEIDPYSIHVASNSRFEVLRNEFKVELQWAVEKKLVSIEQLVESANRIYNFHYMPLVENTRAILSPGYYYNKNSTEWPARSRVREFLFDVHSDIISLFSFAAKRFNPNADFRTLENSALTLIESSRSPRLYDYGEGIPSWVKVTPMENFGKEAATILLNRALQRLEVQVHHLTFQELNVLLEVYSRRIDLIEERTSLVLKKSDPILLGYFRKMRSVVAQVLAQE